MNENKSRVRLRALVESSLLVAIGFALSYVPFIQMPQGGSVTALSMLPILMIGLRHGLKWGLSGGFVYACLQMLQEFWPPPSGTAIAYICVILLDYILAFSVLGLSGSFKGKRYGIVYAAPLCIFLRFLCHFVSGAIIWSSYWYKAESWLFSLTYNGSYMVVELVLTTAVGFALCKSAPILFQPPGAAASKK